MEAPRDVQESKRFRWVGRPSEEELLGTRTAVPRTRAAFASPPPPRAPRLVTAPDAFHEGPRWRFERRDLLALAAIACAIWFAVRGTEGLPFRSSQALEPTPATDVVTAGVALDRRELASIPRRAAAGAAATAPSTGKTSGKGGRSGGSGSGSGSGSKDHPKPPPDETSEPPLLQATVPGVGTVTVDQPDPPVPTETPGVPDAGDLPLAETGGLAGTTTTVVLP
ncbi:MAG TPA: hypothetical protein VE693_02590 [Gaiellaceae bacterium]|nr:hypothetical protein [Gaiellaceae bacterium]